MTDLVTIAADASRTIESGAGQQQQSPLGELVTEKALSVSWRVSVKQLAAMRHAKLRRKIHWDIVNYTVCYTPDGVEKLKDLMPGWIQSGEVEVETKEVIAYEVGLKAKWKVVRIPPNPRMLLIQNQWSMENIWLHVPNNRNFKKNLVIHDSDIGPPDALGHRHLARRLPRFYGRW